MTGAHFNGGRALKNCPCSLSKTRVGGLLLALKNPGRGFYAHPVLSKKIYSGSVDLEEHILARRTTVD